MYPLIVCVCGRSIGDLFDLFKAMQKEKYTSRFGDIEFDPDMIAVNPALQVEVGDILDDLKLTNECCRTKMICQVEFKEVY